LIHLRIGWISDEQVFANVLNALQRFGKALKSLSLINRKDGIDRRINITGNLWVYCEKLEQLSSRFGSATLIDSPPAFHPIEHLIIENGDSDGVERAAKNLMLIGPRRNAYTWPSLRRVTYSQFTWQDLFRDVPSHSAKSQGDTQGTTRVAQKNSLAWVLLEADVPLFDSNGEMLQERYKGRE
jgi:hypothetical protein